MKRSQEQLQVSGEICRRRRRGAPSSRAMTPFQMGRSKEFARKRRRKYCVSSRLQFRS